ncbi:MAG: hypothetical protein IPJ67_00730 [Candidatus Moraniibacteriota bacterium]|nr:MAG: hypothetical protein IPJ67_00730 [Candidatus Moranbacteria bacterium]
MIIGHEAIRDRLRRATEKQCVAQTYIFVGPESVGKLAVAVELAGELLGSASISDCAVIRPERIEEKGKVKELPISVKMIREATHTLGLSGRVGTGNVLIVDDAHKMSEGAQNAFLKTLEEPFPGATIILVTYNEGGMLSTILSRCERVSFALVTGDVLAESFSDVPETIRQLGRPGLCASFRENPEMFADSLRRLDMLRGFALLSLSDRVMLADACTNDIPGAERLLAWWMSALNREMLTVPHTYERRALLERLHAVAATLRDLRRFPGSARLILEQLFFFRKSVSPLLMQRMTKSQFFG